MARPISGTPCPMLTTAAWPEASRNRRPLWSMIQQPSPRAAMGYVFLKFLEKSPVLINVSCPEKNCSRLASAHRNSAIACEQKFFVTPDRSASVSDHPTIQESAEQPAF